MSGTQTGSGAIGQAPAVQRRRYGDAVVTALGDGSVTLPPSVLLGIDEAGVTELLHAAFRTLSIPGSLNAFLVEQDGRRVLVDTGAGPGNMGPTCGKLPQQLAAAGVEPGSVDAVILTHLHPDHIGGLARDGAAAFRNADLYVAEAEAAFWLDPASEGRAPEGMRPYFAMAREAVAPYQARTRLIRDGEILPGIEAVPLPGHTPGHTGYRVGGGSLLIWGDIVHVPDVQAARPEVGVGFDVDPQAARATRERVLDMAATERLAVAGMHMHFPAFSHVVRDGSGYRFVPQGWDWEV